VDNIMWIGKVVEFKMILEVDELKGDG